MLIVHTVFVIIMVCWFVLLIELFNAVDEWNERVKKVFHK